MATLKKRHGKLTVVEVDGQTVTVRCKCGRMIEVSKHNLLRGDHQSCGKGPCKNYNRATYDPNFQPMLPRSMKLASVRKAWEHYHAQDADARLDMRQLAARYHVAYSTLCGIFNAVRKSGGIDKYEEKLA